MKKFSIPLYGQIMLAVGLGSLFGMFFGKDSAHYIANESMGELGMAVIRLLKIFAIPLILLAIIETILKTEITGRKAIKVVCICLFNVSVAMLIGLVILNVFQPGKTWVKHFPQGNAVTATTGAPAVEAAQAQKTPLDPFLVVAKLVPESLVEPFQKNNTIGVVLIAILFGFALKGLKGGPHNAQRHDIEKLVEALFAANLKIIEYIIRIVPYAVLCLVAHAVGKSGFGVFSALWVFLLTVLAGFIVHALIYYPLVAWLVGKKSPRVYLGQGADAIVTGFSTNSSLATMPLTLKTLTERMGISDTSARMGACFATNLNNDGITLYEAITALFIAQAVGLDLSLSAQVFIVLISVFVSMGIAGIPEAGLIILPLVLGASGISESAVAAAIALIIPIDWFIARLRSAVNVMSDMVVAILLDKV